MSFLLITVQSVILVIHEEETAEWAERFEERLYKSVRNFKHLCDVTSPGHPDKQMLQNRTLDRKVCGQ